MAHGHNRATSRKCDGRGFHSVSGERNIYYFYFFFLITTQSNVEFRQSNLNAPRIRRKVGNGSLLMRTVTLVSLVPSTHPAMCGIQREAIKKRIKLSPPWRSDTASNCKRDSYGFNSTRGLLIIFISQFWQQDK